MKRAELIAVIWVLVAAMTNTAVLGVGGDMGGSGQDGSVNHPYLIEDFADFNEFANDPCYWDDCIRMETDVNLAGIVYTTAVIAPDMNNLTTTTYEGTAFTGIFDGNGYAIYNLTIDTADVNNHHLGLFGKIDGSGAGILIILAGYAV